MPRMDGARRRGYGAVGRAEPLDADARLTADTRPDQVAACDEAGMDGYLTKPSRWPTCWRPWMRSRSRTTTTTPSGARASADECPQPCMASSTEAVSVA